jgi:hypothetical protein
VTANHDWLRRYEAGESDAVWREMTALGGEVRHPAHLGEATAVAAATMDRAKTNVERLIGTLPTIGWRFAFPLTSGPGEFGVWNPPRPDVQQVIERLETGLRGPLPLSLAAWWRIVGSVTFMRDGDQGGPEYPDPLVVSPIEHIEAELEEWSGDEIFQATKPIFAGPIAPDAFHKENVSGGAPYEIELPNASADALVLNREPSVTFVSYLRHAFRWAGLPGYSEVFDTPPTEIVRLASALLPI